MFNKYLILFVALWVSGVTASEIKVQHITQDLEKKAFNDSLWKDVPAESISLMGQPMIAPRPKTTNTSQVFVQALQDGKSIAFRMRWKAESPSEAGRLGEFSDAVAIQFPIKDSATTPIFMGDKDNPVHIFHWRAQYQKDHEKGKPEMKDLYPNMNPDMYPMEFKDPGSVTGLNEKKREVYSPGKAEGNPQSYSKSSAVDEIFAEGFGSSSVIENKASIGHGTWANGEWTVVIARTLKKEGGSSLDLNKNAAVAFAVWQGAKKEVGSRKCLTMMWVPLVWSKQ